MKTSTQFGLVTKKFGEEDSIKILAEAGFEAMDYSVTANMIPWEEGFFTDIHAPEFAEHFKGVAKIAKDNNIEICMTHASYVPTFIDDPAEYAKTQAQTIRGIYATKYLESPYIVAHPVLHPDFNNGQNKEQALEANLDYFSAFVPALKETGVIMCIENLFWGLRTDPKTPNSCTSAEQMIEIIDTLNAMHGPCFAACLDTGHATIAGQDPIQMLKKLANRVKVLHIQDNKGVLDNHVLPGHGMIDWKEFMKTLREVGYSGCFNFEADQHWADYKKEIYDRDVMVQAARLKYTVGRALLNLIN